MVIGARDRFEIWSVGGWEAYLSATDDEDLSALPLPF
jgi:DNA-binding transcriptional regulator/RsmH inhibitor MraZ